MCILFVIQRVDIVRYETGRLESMKLLSESLRILASRKQSLFSLCFSFLWWMTFPPMAGDQNNFNTMKLINFFF